MVIIKGGVLTDKLILKQIPVGPFQVMTYLAACPQTREGVIIDPAGEEDNLLALIEKQDVKVKYILNTHGHADHVFGNQKLKDSLKVPVCMHEDDDRFFADEAVREKSLEELGLPPSDSADIQLKDGDVLKAGTLNVEVIHTPGHTPGHMALSVSSGGEQLLCISDTVLHPVHLEQPEWCAVVDNNPQQVASSRRKLLSLAATEKALVLAFHFPFPGLGHVIPRGDGWQWQPIEIAD